MIQCLREAFPFDDAAGFLIFDRDAGFSVAVRRAIEALGIEPCITAYRGPWQNGVAERWVGSVRRELLDHVVVFNERLPLAYQKKLVVDSKSELG